MHKLMARPYIDLSCTRHILELTGFEDGRKEQGREETLHLPFQTEGREMMR